MKQENVNVPSGWKITHTSDNKIVLEKEKEIYTLPSTWGMYYEKFVDSDVKHLECFMDLVSSYPMVGTINSPEAYSPKYKREKGQVHVHSKEIGEALVALWKLTELRGAYIGDWKPIGLEHICIVWSDTGVPHKGTHIKQTSPLLTFPTKELRDQFYENFKDIIEEAKMFL